MITKKKKKRIKHNKRKNNKQKIGFTNKLAIYLVLLLTLSLILGFYLAIKSIQYQYTGALVCWSCVIAPLDACLGVVLVKVVDKSKAENLGADGTGISFAAAQATNFRNTYTNRVNTIINESSSSAEESDPSITSPQI